MYPTIFRCRWQYPKLGFCVPIPPLYCIFSFSGADGRIHSVTKYSPLYIAAYNGRRDIVDILLKRFPNLINVLTVEKWSPLHAAVINGHVSTLDLLLRFSYPKECLKTMRDKKGEHNVRFLLKTRENKINFTNIFLKIFHKKLTLRKHKISNKKKSVNLIHGFL